MTTAHAKEVRRQTAMISTFLRRACPVCSMFPCDPETHEATLRVRRGVNPPPMKTPVKVVRPPAFLEQGVGCTCDRCGSSFSSLNAEQAKYCPACRLAVTRQAAKSQTERKKAARHAARGNGIATNGAVAPRRSA